MKAKNLLFSFALSVCSIFVVPLAAEPIKLSPVSPVSPRLAAMGGPHAAQASGIDALFENPAGFASEDTVLSAAALAFNFSGPVFDIANLFFSGGDPIASIPSILDPAGRLYVGLELAGPISFGFVGKGLGFGIFNGTAVKIDAISLLNASLLAGEDILIAGGYAHRISLEGGHAIDLGIMPKAFIRAQFLKNGTIEDLMNTVLSPADLLGATPFRIVSGIGVDAGARWTSPFGLALGIAARDAYSPAMVSEYASFGDYQASPSSSPVMGLVPADISVGLLYALPFRFLSDVGLGVNVMLDYRDLLNLFEPLPRNAILNLSAGLELALLDILFVRGGIREALPSAGLGLDLSWFAVNLAMYGRELGMEPGTRPVFNLALSFDFRY